MMVQKYIISVQKKYSLFFFWLILFALSILPIIVLQLESRQELNQRKADLRREWLEKCRFFAGSLQRASDYNFWPEEAARVIKRRMQKLAFYQRKVCEDPVKFNEYLGKAAVLHRPAKLPPYLLWGAMLRNADPNAGMILCRHNNLQQDYASMTTGLLQDLCRQYLFERSLDKTFGFSDTQSKKNGIFDLDRIKKLERLFGSGLSAELFSESHRGLAFNVIFRNKYHLLVWDLFFNGDRPVGGFILLMPVNLNSDLRALKLSLANWSAKNILPGFIRIPSSDSENQPTPVLHGRLPKERTVKSLEKIRSQIGFYRNQLFASQSCSISLATAMMDKIIPVGDGNDSCVYLTPLHQLSRHIGVLIFRLPAVKGLIFELPTEMAIYSWIIVWTMFLVNSFLFGFPSRPGVRQEMTVWLFGVIAMPVFLSIGSGVQFNEDLYSNRLNEQEHDLSQVLHSLDNGIYEANDRILRLCRTEFDRPLILAALREAHDSTEQGEKIFHQLLEIFQSARIPLIGLRISSRKKILAEKFLPDMSSLSLKSLKLGLQEAWLNFLNTQKPEENPLRGTEGVALKSSQDPLARLRGQACLMRGSEESPRVWRSGERQYYLVRRVLGEKNSSEFLISAVWGLDKLFLPYLQSAISNPILLAGKPDISIAVYSTNPLEEIGATSGDLGGRADILKYAGRALSHPIRRFDREKNELLIAWKSEKMPGFILLGRASLEKATHEIVREWSRLVFLFMGLLVLVFAAVKLLSARLATPVIRLTESLHSVSQGNFETRIVEDRLDELGQASLDLDQMTRWLDERKHMSQFVSTQVMEIVAAGSESDAMRGTQREVIILVSDIRSFTTLSETYPPHDIFSMLNNHMEIMTKAIQAEGGVIDRFIGDAIQAVFYVNPSDVESTAAHAVKAAIAMRKAHLSLVEQRLSKGLFIYEIGIGIEKGTVIAGVMGDRNSRLDFTVIGDILQAAAEFEALSKEGSHTRIIVSERVYQETSGLFSYERLSYPLLPAWEVGSIEPLSLQNMAVAPPDTASPGVSLITSGERIEVGKPFCDSGMAETPSLPLVIPTARPAIESNLIHDFSWQKRVHDRFSSFGGIWIILMLWLIPPIMMYFIINWFQEGLVMQAQAVVRNEVQNELSQAETTLTPEIQADRLLRHLIAKCSATLPSKACGITNYFPEASWFYFSPKKIMERVAGATDSAVPSFQEDDFLLANSHKDSSLPLSKDEIQILHLFFHIKCFSGILSTQHDWDTGIPQAIKGKLFNMYDGDCLDKIGSSGLLQKVSQSSDRFSQVSIRGRSFFVFWHSVLKNSESVSKQTLAGNFLVFVPASILTPENGHRYFLANMEARGFRAAFLMKQGKRSRLVSSRHFSQFRSLIATGWKRADPFVGSWFLTSEQLSEPDKSRLILAGNWNNALPKTLMTAIWGKIVGFVWFFLGMSFFLLLILNRIPAGFTLRKLLAGAFALVVIPALFIAFFTIERNLIERKIRLISDKKRFLLETLQTTDFSLRLFKTYACNIARRCIGLSGIRERLLSMDNDKDSMKKGLAEDITRHLSVIWQSSGIQLKSTEFTSVAGIKGGHNVNDGYLECFRRIHAANLMVLNPAVSRNEEQKNKELLIGSQLDDFMQIMPSILPSRSFASWMMAPQALLNFITPFEGERSIYIQRALFQGHPRWVVELSWDQETCFRLLMMNLEHDFLATGSEMVEIGASFAKTPSWKLIAPFWEDSAWDEFKFSPVMSHEKPGITLFALKAAESTKTVDGFSGSEKSGRLVVAMPGNEVANIIFTAAIPSAKIFMELQNQSWQQRRVLLIFAIIAFVLAIGVTQGFLEPLILLSRAAKQIMLQNFEVRLETVGNDEFVQMARAFNDMATGVQQRERLSHYVSESVQVTARDQEREQAAMAGESLDVTVMFIGLGNFKTCMKLVSPHLLVQNLNSFLEMSAAIIKKHGGEVDKFMGEKVLAVFNPRSIGSVTQAHIAGMSASQELHSAMFRLPLWQKQPLGIGLVSGKVLSGILGTHEVRREYTVIGDTVNLASRLCDLAIRENGGTVVDEKSLEYAVDSDLSDYCGTFAHLGEIAVKGKARKISCLISHGK
ncbi:MAG: HAMP domain-containing protein [Candidatus Riflebacteria bacterium]|nr:HAMP domain-containing protein [Candidatus Riflebacteria bacterium]